MPSKLYFSVIPLQPKPVDRPACEACGRGYGGGLKKVQYTDGYSGEEHLVNIKSEPTRFPLVQMIKSDCDEGESITVVLVKTLDSCGNTDYNLGLLREELREVSENLGITVNEKIIEIDHNENPDKQIKLMRALSHCFSENDNVYMDITYGTKATEIAMFSALSYAEKLCGCKICKICYGKLNHDTHESEIYNVFSLYAMNSIIQNAPFVPKETVKKMVEELWGEDDEK